MSRYGKIGAVLKKCFLSIPDGDVSWGALLCKLRSEK